ncbi:multiple organellar RNA editing factor 8, chloroplastic/mitochondrial-like isoform X2 [Telopea speciosissima]|uniref:multiple organellar RNA editing factor 8, chloroplastic/mitochondrial-like isoform X2 n=1 Tax=Telopea speciosissima TaxID=54955 RepID=UPI001CC675A6|nr:multiple organellar RNA editing factor 8, chloroplastic/mitochondrial-like isoform X2 [Telopea speciosissima]
MAVAFLGRSFITKPSVAVIFSRSFTSAFISVPGSAFTSRYSSPLLRLRPLVALTQFNRISPAPFGLRCFATRQTSSSLNDPNPNWSNRPPKETILLDGCDFEHWLIVMEKPEGDPTRDEIIDSYIKTLAMVVGSEEEARMKIYSVSTRCYFAFGALISEELSYKMKELPRVRWVLPDSYLDVRNKDYGGEPFINGQAVPYDPKYHEEWVRNNARANERSRRNDRPRNFDRSRNFERRRENMQNRDFQGGPPPNMGGPPRNPMPNMGGPPRNPMPNMGGAPPNPMPNMGGMPNVQNQMTNRDAGPGAGFPNVPNREMGGMPPRDFQNRDAANSGAMPYQSRDMPTGSMQNRDNQSSYVPNRDMGNMPSGNHYQVRDIPGRDYQ